MLYNDTDFVTSVDMAAIDPEILVVANAQKISIDGPGGIAAGACDEAGQKILQETQAFSGFMPPFAMPYNQTAAVLNLVGPTINRSRIALAQLVVSPINPMEMAVSKPSHFKRYVIYMAITMLYRAAFMRKENDRYDAKRKMFEEEIRKYYWPRLFNQGCPVAYKPMACPGAIHEYNAGFWGQANVTTPAGAGLNQAIYDVAISWVDQTKYQSPMVKGNAESAPSARVTNLTVNAGQVISISTVGLNPPNGMAPINVQLGQSLIVPGNASGWNVYVGNAGGVMFLQNPTPIPILTTSYTLASDPVLAGYMADCGQYADAFFTCQKTLMRG